MAEFEEKLSSILSNPELMGQIMSMAGSLNQQPAPPPPPTEFGGMPCFPNVQCGQSHNNNVNELLAARSGQIPQLAVALGSVDASLDAVKHRAFRAAYSLGKLAHGHQVVSLTPLVE